MDGKRNSRDRSVSRRCETNRLEDELWTLAYEHVWPLVRKVLNQNSSSPRNESQAAPKAASIATRSA